MPHIIEYALAGYCALYLIREATVWSHLNDLARRRATPREFVQALWGCPVCLGFWVTSPALYLGPIRWLAINGLLVFAAGLSPIQPRES